MVDAYDTVDATSADPTTIDVQSNGSSSPTTSSTGSTTTEKVSNRVLFSIFEGLDSEDMTVDDYPASMSSTTSSKTAVTPDWTRTPSTPHTIDRWYREEKKEDHEGHEEDDDSGKEVTQKALFAVFESMEGKKSEFTDDGKYPLVSKVNERAGEERLSPHVPEANA